MDSGFRFYDGYAAERSLAPLVSCYAISGSGGYTGYPYLLSFK